jgi:hypothetical protein
MVRIDRQTYCTDCRKQKYGAKAAFRKKDEWRPQEEWRRKDNRSHLGERGFSWDGTSSPTFRCADFSVN